MTYPRILIIEDERSIAVQLITEVGKALECRMSPQDMGGKICEGDNGMGKTILLVDDNQLFIEIEKEFLQYTRLDILTAKDGLEALAVLKIKRPDLVVMDLEMPIMDGASCCQAIKSDVVLGNTPVILVTAKINENKCYLAGGDYFLPKPLDRDVFLDAVRKYIPDIDRREKRLDVDIDCILHMSNETISCSLKNLSMGGAFVITDYFGVPNSVVHINFKLPDGTVIDCSGRIVWINRTEGTHPKGLGVKFALMSKAAKAALKIFINSDR